MEPSPSSSSSSPPAPSSSSSPSRCSEQRKLFVGGIPSATTEEKLKEHFEKYGEVREVAVMRDRITKNGRGFGFVQFADPGAAERVLDEKEKGNHVICGRAVCAILSAVYSSSSPLCVCKERGKVFFSLEKLGFFCVCDFFGTFCSM